ncbi:hypothetical protein B2I21_35195 [Chryseobacterium mucoviscidosis]|nr:hypothetical protein B2I21_35195 [Chryseobacterium mucoviscidosis]
MKKHVKNISLVLSGVVLGVAISFSGEISAATSKLLGGKVGKVMTVTLDKKSIGEAPVIGGTSYVPVRTAANELGLEVKVSGNEIKLTTQNEVSDNSDQITAQKDSITREMNTIKVQIKEYESVVSNKEAILRGIDSDTEYVKQMEESRARGSEFYSIASIEGTKDSIAKSKKILEDAEANLPTLKQKLAGLELQLAELDK